MSSLKICLSSGYEIKDSNLISTVNYIYNKNVDIEEILNQLQKLLYSLCTIYSNGKYNKDNFIELTVYPWVIDVFKSYKEKGYIIEEVVEIPSGVYGSDLNVSFIDKQSNPYDLLAELKRALLKEINNIVLHIF